jgi:DNA-directed RNA polymerase subunit F
MIGKKVASEKPVPLAKVLEILEDRKKQDELEYEQRLAYDYAQKFARPDPEKAEKLISELLALGKFKERQAVILVDLMPETKEDIELIFAKERTRLDEEDIKKVLELLGKYRE